MLNVAAKSGLLASNPLSRVKWLKNDATFDRFRTGKELEELAATGEQTEEELAELRRNWHVIIDGPSVRLGRTPCSRLKPCWTEPTSPSHFWT